MTTTTDSVISGINYNEANNHGNNDGAALEYFLQIGSSLKQTITLISGLSYQISGLDYRITQLGG